MASDRKLTDDQLAQLRALEGREPDTADIPEAPAAHWRLATRGAFFKPRKQAISLRVDMDVLDWLRSYGPGYQSRINDILRRQMASEQVREG
ncbi:MAG: BrnA antitoxin family protein [Acetobacteraceae bacterium]